MQAYIGTKFIKTDYHVFPGTHFTVCCLTLDNGHYVIGTSIGMGEEFNEDMGRKTALDNAMAAWLAA